MARKAESHPSSREGHRKRATTEIMKRKKIVWKSIGVFGETTSRSGRTPLRVADDTRKFIAFNGKKSTIQIIHKNDGDLQNQDLHGLNDVPLVFVNEEPLIITDCMRSIHFHVAIEEKYIGKSSENFVFDFENIILKVKIDIEVADESLYVPYGIERRSKVDILRLYKLHGNPGQRGERPKKLTTPWTLKPWRIPKKFWDCRALKDSKEKMLLLREGFPVVFEPLTYGNYQDKFHTLLDMNEIEIIIALQTYAQKSVQFEKNGEYLVLKIPNLSERRPSLIPYDKVVVEPCKPKLMFGKKGDVERYEGIINRVLANEIWLKFCRKFHRICGAKNEWYKVDFFNDRLNVRKQHDIVENHGLDEAFLFPKGPILTYQSPKLYIDTTGPDTDAETASWTEMKRNRKMTRSTRQKAAIGGDIGWSNPNLNCEQKSAVINILRGEGRPTPYIIYGPPGTGKTITLLECIVQITEKFPENKLLICAPTNTAVNLLLDKLIETRKFSATVMKRVVSVTHFNSPLWNPAYDEYCILPPSNLDCVRYSNDSKSTVENRFPEFRIIVTTECMAGSLRRMGLATGVFSHVFIDEAGQSMEPDMLFPLSFSNRDVQVILSGDPKQLGPVVMSKDAKDSGLGRSMLARLIDIPHLYQRDLEQYPEHNGYNPRLVTFLIKNYRSLPEIVHVFNSLFYQNLLVPTKTRDDDEERILLNNLNRNPHWICLTGGRKGPVIVHGVKGCESKENNSPSWFNPHEALYVFLYFVILSEAGISADEIGIITPYGSQVAKINLLLKKYYPRAQKLPKVSSVELFQGQERTVIIISLVRSLTDKEADDNRGGRTEFLAADERINVAMSRAKALVVVIGNPSTMKNSKWETILSNAIGDKNYLGCKN